VERLVVKEVPVEVLRIVERVVEVCFHVWICVCVS
jgi:hypothetical protein